MGAMLISENEMGIFQTNYGVNLYTTFVYTGGHYRRIAVR